MNAWIPRATDDVATVEMVVIKPGETLSDIAEGMLGNANDWHTLYDENGDQLHGNPNLLHIGQRIHVDNPKNRNWVYHAPAPVQLTADTVPKADPAPAAPAMPSASVPAGGDVVDGIWWGTPGPDDAAIGALWNEEGGPPSQDANSECIADHESGDRINVLSPSDDEGLMQINVVNAPTAAMENPYANMAEAVKLYDADGWSPWTTAPGCGI